MPPVRTPVVGSAPYVFLGQRPAPRPFPFPWRFSKFRQTINLHLVQIVSAGEAASTQIKSRQRDIDQVAARVLRNTMASVALRRPDDRIQALRDTIAELLSMDEPRRQFAAMMSGLDIHYDLGEGHPLLGRRMPDLDLVTANGPVRVFTLLHAARPVLLNLGWPRRVSPGWTAGQSPVARRASTRSPSCWRRWSRRRRSWVSRTG
jgi:hypothetical protein